MVFAQVMQPDGPSLLELVTLLIAVGGFGLAVFSLWTQRRQFRESGSVVRVALRGCIVGDTDPPREGINIEASNVGRLGVSVTQWGAVISKDWIYMHFKPLAGNTPLPHRIEPGDSASWWLPLAELRQQMAKKGIKKADIPMFVKLATGEMLVTQTTMEVVAAS
jgi:hypothetical protein